MHKISKNYYLIGLGVVLAAILAFFPTSEFIHQPYVLNTFLKQQHHNLAGIYTISPFEAAKFYSDDQQGNCYWLDVRDTSEFSKSHLKVAINQTLSQLKNTVWKPNDMILIYGNNTKEAQDAVAYLRQVKNARAFAIKGGFEAVKKYLIDPIGIAVTNQFSDKQLTSLIELRSEISGEKVSPQEMLKKLKSSKKKTVREGC